MTEGNFDLGQFHASLCKGRVKFKFKLFFCYSALTYMNFVMVFNVYMAIGTMTSVKNNISQSVCANESVAGFMACNEN